MTTFDRIANLPLAIDGYDLDFLERNVSSGFLRKSTIITLRGGGEAGIGEDVSYDTEDHDAAEAAGTYLPLAGTWTLASFCDHVEALDLFSLPPVREVSRRYRIWAYESAALDLALRQAGTSLHEHLGITPRPVRFVCSLRLADPGEAPSLEPLSRRLHEYPTLQFKLDPTPDWSDELIAGLQATGAVESVDLKGLYEGTSVDAPADPGTINFVPRPDWYFYFLFYLLRIFKWPETVVIGTVGLPTVLLVMLIAVPFVDLRTERRLTRRPVAVVASFLVVISMGVLTYKGATAKEALGSELRGHVPAWAAKQGFTGNTQAIAGAQLFAVAGCLNCHIYLGDGGQNLGAPNLTAEGAKNKGVAFQVRHLQNPASVNAGSPMPSFAGLGNDRLKQLAIFLEASKGPKK